MAEHLVGQNRSVSQAAENQMRQWAQGLEIQSKLERQQAEPDLSEGIHPYVAVSRESGAGGGEIAAAVAEQLGWDLLDQELLHFMAEKYKTPDNMLEFVDETTSNWLVEFFGKWLNKQVVTQAEYVTHLGRIVLLAARHSNTVLVGRGAQFFLPRHKGLVVQIIAPRPARIERIASEQALSTAKATEYVDHHDQGRRDFVKKYFHHDVADPHLYDLVINLAHLDQETAVRLITELALQRV